MQSPPSHAPFVVACVKWGERYGPYYVNALYEQVSQHLPAGFSFECFTEDAAGLNPCIKVRALPGDLPGWWNKLYMFKEAVFSPEQKILYFDLDTLILGPLDELMHYTGKFALLRDFYRPQGYGSGVMAWRAKAGYPIWSQFEAAGRPLLAGGDQAWIEKVSPSADLLQDCFPGMFASYKTDCSPHSPPAAHVVCFHGEPKQDNCDAPWVQQLWHTGGLHEQETTARKNYPLVAAVPAHERHAVIIGGGASLSECVDELRGDIGQGHSVFAVNGSPLWLREQGFMYDMHVVGNISAHDAALLPEMDVACYYASTCPPSVLENVQERLTLWQPAEGISSTGLQAIMLAHKLGYHHFHLYGFDSCNTDGAHHAYDWPAEERNRRFTTELHGRRFQASMWMLQQADEFIRLADGLLKEGCTFSIHGDGMLHFLALQATSSGTAS